MKKFKIYKNIRKRATIFGLPISLFAVMMISIITTLLVIIFSLSLAMVIGMSVLNAALYLALSRITKAPGIVQFANSFPRIISNKRNSNFHYEKD